jgi:hypothetical protein
MNTGKNRRTVGSDVFYAVYAEAVYQESTEKYGSWDSQSRMTVLVRVNSSLPNRKSEL